MPFIIGGGMLVGGLVQGGLGYLANQQQADASADAMKQQIRAQREAREYQAQMAGQANNLLSLYGGRAANALSGGYASGMDSLRAGNAGAASALETGYRSSLGNLQAGYGQANQTLGSGLANAQGQLQSGYGAAQSALSPLMALQGYGAQAAQAVGTNQRLDALLGGNLSRENAYAGFQADPGYQFRQQQGEQAINRSAAAQGGRLGGRTLAALADYNQNLASNEYQNFANRRAALNSMQMQGAQSADAAQLNAALQAQQNQMGLANVGYNAQGQSADLQRMLGSQLSGLTMGGAQAMAGNQAALGQGEANLASGYGSNLANLRATGGQQLAGMQTAQGSGLASLYQGQGANMASNLTGVANANTQLTGAMIPQYQAGTQYAGAGLNAIGQTVGNLTQNLGYLGMLYGGGAGGNGYTPQQNAWAAYGNQYFR